MACCAGFSRRKRVIKRIEGGISNTGGKMENGIYIFEGKLSIAPSFQIQASASRVAENDLHHNGHIEVNSGIRT